MTARIEALEAELQVRTPSLAAGFLAIGALAAGSLAAGSLANAAPLPAHRKATADTVPSGGYAKYPPGDTQPVLAPVVRRRWCGPVVLPLPRDLREDRGLHPALVRVWVRVSVSQG